MRVRSLGYAAGICLALLMSGATAAAQTVDEIVARHLEARGGMEKLKAIQSLRITRTVATGIGTTLRVVVYKKRPQFYRAEQGPVQGTAPLVPRGVNPEAAWDTMQGKTVLRPEQAAAETRDLDADFDGPLVDWKAKGHTVTYEGLESLPGGAIHKLAVTTKSGVARTIYLDAKTYLDRRHTGSLTLPNGRKAEVTIDFGNWRDVDGVKFPFDLEEERTGAGPVQTFVFYTQQIEVNVPLEDALFATPGKS